jgi:hypothetical protein
MRRKGQESHVTEEELLNALTRSASGNADARSCLDSETLRRFLAGVLDGESERERILAHLSGCECCSNILTELRNGAAVLRHK